MSDLEHASLPGLRRKSEAATGWVNTNKVLQTALLQCTNKVREKVVLRCDDLPLVYGNEDDFNALFSCLMQLILRKLEEVPTLFLHIHCTREETSTTPWSFNFFSIHFNTNISPCTTWWQTNEQAIAQAETLIQKHGGHLIVNESKASGCIFSVSLPGKFL